MRTVRKRTYESRNEYQDVFARIRLDTERVATLVQPLVGNQTVDTNKPWVGKINSSEGTFSIVEPNPSILPWRFFEGNFFTIFVHGEVVSEQNNTRIDVKFKLGWHGAVTFLLAYLFPIIWTTKSISEDNWDDVKGLVPWISIFVFIPTILLLFQLNRIEKKTSELLGAK